MFLNFVCHSSFILILFRCYTISLAEEAKGKQRFIIEEDFKPPIFGSNKFNPVLQIFEDVNETNQTSSSIVYNNETAITVTAIGEMGSDTTLSIDMQKRAMLFGNRGTFSTIKPTLWWTKPIKRTNATRKVPIH